MINLNKLDRFVNFVEERQRIFWQRVNGMPRPWTNNAILRRHKFCNVYRILDRYNQHLLERVIEPFAGKSKDANLIFKIFLHRILCNENSYTQLSNLAPDQVMLSGFHYQRTMKILDSMDSKFSTAYVSVSAPAQLEAMGSVEMGALINSLAEKGAAVSRKKFIDTVVGFPGFGLFTAFQISLDLGYWDKFAAWDDEGTVEFGPGSLAGADIICPGIDAEITAKDLTENWDRISDDFDSLACSDNGEIIPRPLKIEDMEHCLCEFFKLERYMDDYESNSNKKLFSPGEPLKKYRFPRHWNMEDIECRK